MSGIYENPFWKLLTELFAELGLGPPVGNAPLWQSEDDVRAAIAKVKALKAGCTTPKRAPIPAGVHTLRRGGVPPVSVQRDPEFGGFGATPLGRLHKRQGV